MPNVQYSSIEVLGDKIPYIHRDISWLGFNYRVLQEAKDIQLPLFERIKFLAIYSNNLDEFFRVRVANNRNLIRVGKKTKKQFDYDPNEIQNEITQIVNKQQLEFSDIFFNSIRPALKKYDIHLIQPNELTSYHEIFVDEYFKDYMLPFVQPVYLKGQKIKPFLNNAALYLAIHLKDKSVKRPPSEYAIVRIPSDQLPRFIQLPEPDQKKSIMMLDDVIRSRIQYFFPGYHIIESYSLKLSRDAELYIDDEYSGDLISKIKKSLSKRNVGPASRLVYDRDMPKHMLKFFTEILGVSDMDLFQEGRYHNNFDFFKFPDFNLSYLRNKSLKPIRYAKLEKAVDIFDAIKKGDHLIHVPYHRYDSVIHFFEKAADDANVTHIKVVQYRVAKDSKIMNALIRAVSNGKHVSVFVEVKARFDEASNLTWGEKLQRHGIHVQYSFPGLKVHAKMAFVLRREGQSSTAYCYLSTGNFHEKTAKIYSDIGLFTADQTMANDVAHLFTILETGDIKKYQFQQLLVGKFNLRESFEELILFEIGEARAGRKAEIFLKMNSLQDKYMIALLYKASRAGVKVKLIIRGICSLVAGLKGWSENIKVISIVDRYLEHTRIFSFHHGGSKKLYAGSADWMERNLSRRIETIFPIMDKCIQGEIMDFLELQWSDNVKARHIHHKKNNQFKKGKPVMRVQSQIETFLYYKRKNDKIKNNA